MRLWLVRAVVAGLILASGIALGAGPLQHGERERDRQLATEERAQDRALERARDRVEDLDAAAAHAEEYAAATAGVVVAGRLEGRTVGLVLLPGADPATADALGDLLAAAGATVSVEAALEPALAEGGSRRLVAALTDQLVEQDSDLSTEPQENAYRRVGGLLARALGADRGAGPKGSAYDRSALGIVSALEAADLVRVTEASPRASLTVFLAGPAAVTADAAARNDVPVAIVAGFNAVSPAVLAAPADAAGPYGVLGTLRSRTADAALVTGIDSVEASSGRVAVVLALAARVSGVVGQFGGVGAAGGAVPES